MLTLRTLIITTTIGAASVLAILLAAGPLAKAIAGAMG